MKKILIAATLAAFAVSPALAQQTQYGPTGPEADEWETSAQYNTPSQAFMYAPAQGYNQSGMGFAGSAPDVVIENGVVVGQDPDADVRLELRRGAQTGD
jgi:hypothetical protein